MTSWIVGKIRNSVITCKTSGGKTANGTRLEDVSMFGSGNRKAQRSSTCTKFTIAFSLFALYFVSKCLKKIMFRLFLLNNHNLCSNSGRHGVSPNLTAASNAWSFRDHKTALEASQCQIMRHPNLANIKYILNTCEKDILNTYLKNISNTFTKYRQSINLYMQLVIEFHEVIPTWSRRMVTVQVRGSQQQSRWKTLVIQLDLLSSKYFWPRLTCKRFKLKTVGGLWSAI